MDRNYTAKEICAILEACGNSGVETVQVCGLSAKFHKGAGAPAPITTDTAVSEYSDPDYDPVTRSTVNGPITEETRLHSSEEEAIMEQTNQQQLMIDDPMAYEQNMIDGLVDAERIDSRAQEITRNPYV